MLIKGDNIDTHADPEPQPQTSLTTYLARLGQLRSDRHFPLLHTLYLNMKLREEEHVGQAVESPYAPQLGIYASVDS
jgi:hypothetical protein